MINWMNITSRQRWQIALGQVLTFWINGTNVTAIPTTVIDAAIDSSSNFISLPKADYNALLSNIIRTKDINCTRETWGTVHCNCTNVTDPKFFNISMRMANRYIFYINST